MSFFEGWVGVFEDFDFFALVVWSDFVISKVFGLFDAVEIVVVFFEVR